MHAPSDQSPATDPRDAFGHDDCSHARLILDTHDADAFKAIASLSVGEFGEWLLAYETTGDAIASAAAGITPEMAAAVSKLMRNQDLILAASKVRVVTRFRNTLGLAGRFSTRLQPNHPADDPKGIAASIPARSARSA